MADLSPAALALLLDAAPQKSLLKGGYLVKEGQVCKAIYFLESGSVRTFYNKDGKEINTRFSFENSFVTDLKSLRMATPADYSIQASEETVFWEFGKETLLNLYRQSPEIESFGRNLLEQMLLDQEEHANLFKIFSPTERYQYVAQHFPQLLQRISLSQLSSYLGIARETLSRIRKNP
ncbi:Crp/Fnr family transcriptional regulator [Larkinella ripae]